MTDPVQLRLSQTAHLTCGLFELVSPNPVSKIATSTIWADFAKIENAPPSIPDSPAPTESNDPRIIRLNKFGRHEDTSTGLVFKEIEGVVSAYGIQKSDGEVLPISKELHLYCHKKGFPVAELDEWEEDEEYSSEEENDNDSSSSKDLSENDMTDGEDIIEEEKGAKDNSS